MDFWSGLKAPPWGQFATAILVFVRQGCHHVNLIFSSPCHLYIETRSSKGNSLMIQSFQPSLTFFIQLKDAGSGIITSPNCTLSFDTSVTPVSRTIIIVTFSEEVVKMQKQEIRYFPWMFDSKTFIVTAGVNPNFTCNCWIVTIFELYSFSKKIWAHSHCQIISPLMATCRYKRHQLDSAWIQQLVLVKPCMY